MDNAFKHLSSFLVVYVDDILISSQTLEEHCEHLKIFAETAIKEEICLNEKKATIEQEKIEFLGFELGSNGISLQDHISRKISEYPDELRTKNQIQGFLGLLNYASSYIPNLAKKKKDLQSLFKKIILKGEVIIKPKLLKILKKNVKIYHSYDYPNQKIILLCKQMHLTKYDQRFLRLILMKYVDITVKHFPKLKKIIVL